MNQSRFLTYTVAVWLSFLAAHAIGATPLSTQASQVSPAGNGGVFDVRALGAAGDGKANDTAAIQKAIDQCAAAGGGTVRLSKGTYLSASLWLKSRITLRLEAGATLQGSADPAAYRPHPDKTTGRWSGKLLGLINAVDETDLAIVGEGVIDGAGAGWWKRVRDAQRANQREPDRPRMIQFCGCRRIRVAGVTLRNSPMFHLVPSFCQDIDILGLTIQAPADSPNTDGIDLRSSRHARISGCRIDVGDDNIALKAGYGEKAHASGVCEDVCITECTSLNGHGISIGSDTAGGVRQVSVSNCTFEGTTNGIRIKSMRDRGGTVEDIRYRNLSMKNVDPAITINAYYHKPPKKDTAQPITAQTPIFRNIRIANLSATCPRSAGLIVGLPESLVSDVILENVQISATSGLVIRNAKDIELKNVQVNLPEGPRYILENAEVKGAGPP